MGACGGRVYRRSLHHALLLAGRLFLRTHRVLLLGRRVPLTCRWLRSLPAMALGYHALLAMVLGRCVPLVIFLRRVMALVLAC